MIHYEPGQDHTEAFIATGTAIALALSAAATAGTSVYAANKSAGAAKDAAQAQVDATKLGVDAQTKAAADALAFQKQQAEQTWRDQETTRKANYDQWAAREGRISSLSAALGAGPRNIAAYVPSQDPNLDPAAQPGASGPTAGPTDSAHPPGVVDWTAPDPQLAQQLSAFFKSRGVSDHETPYWVQQRPELVARAKELNDPGYATKRLMAAEVFGGGGGSASARMPATLAAAATYQPTVTTPFTPGIQAPAVGSLASYARQRF